MTAIQYFLHCRAHVLIICASNSDIHSCVCVISCVSRGIALPCVVLQVLSKHSQVLGRGLMVDMPTINHILNGEIPVVTDSSEQVFLRDFIENKAATAGGRLAR